MPSDDPTTSATATDTSGGPRSRERGGVDPAVFRDHLASEVGRKRLKPDFLE